MLLKEYNMDLHKDTKSTSFDIDSQTRQTFYDSEYQRYKIELDFWICDKSIDLRGVPVIEYWKCDR